jgi:hypothetical protein
VCAVLLTVSTNSTLPFCNSINAGCVPQVAVALDPACQPQLDSSWAAMQRLSAAGRTDTPEAKRLVNEYRQATGERLSSRGSTQLFTFPCVIQHS